MNIPNLIRQSIDCYQGNPAFFVFKVKSYIHYHLQRLLTADIWAGDETVYTHGDIVLTLPNTLDTQAALDEVFTKQFYRNISWCDCVLDLWWYMWESACYLASNNNKEIISVEMSPATIWYLTKNCAQFPSKIKTYHAGVVAQDNVWPIYADKSNGGMWDQIVYTGWDKTMVESIHIQELLDDHSPDGLKMDIEWSERPIIQYLIQENTFDFKKWVIEFHITRQDEHLPILQTFITYLKQNHYSAHRFDHSGTLDIENIDRLPWVFQVEFEKMTQPNTMNTEK